MFLFCNPHNPLGIVWTAEDIQKMMKICQKYGLLVVSDEIHSDLIFHGKKHTPTVLAAPFYKDHIITCVSATKTFNLAGLQASTTIFPDEDMKARFDTYWSSMDIHRNNAFSSVAMEAAYREGKSGWNSFLPTFRIILILFVLIVKNIFLKSNQIFRMQRTLCGLIARSSYDE